MAREEGRDRGEEEHTDRIALIQFFFFSSSTMPHALGKEGMCEMKGNALWRAITCVRAQRRDTRAHTPARAEVLPLEAI